MTTETPYLGTPETEDPPEPVECRALRIDLDCQQQPRCIQIIGTLNVERWIVAALGDEYLDVPALRFIRDLDIADARRLLADAGQQLPVTHESHAVYDCLSNIINRFDDE